MILIDKKLLYKLVDSNTEVGLRLRQIEEMVFSHFKDGMCDALKAEWTGTKKQNSFADTKIR